MPIQNEIKFLNFICKKIKIAYPGFLVAPDPSGSFALTVKTDCEDAPCLDVDLCKVFRRYSQADEEVARQPVVERFLSALGNTIFHMDTLIAPETFAVHLRPQAKVDTKKGELYMPFRGDLGAALMRKGGDRMQPVTGANLDMLGLSKQQGFALAMKNTLHLDKEINQAFEPDWPGLIFMSAEFCSPSALIYRDVLQSGHLPDGAYYICDETRYIYASARDEVAVAALVAYQRHLSRDIDRIASTSLLLRKKGIWQAVDLSALAKAA